MGAMASVNIHWGTGGESRSTVELIDNNTNTNNTALVVCQL